jgi:maltooligosyltrehalose trehalohydrolase
MRGATPLADGSTRFEVWAPHAGTLAVRLEADGRTVPLARLGDGVFGAVVPGVGPGTDYRLVVDERALPDPVSRHQPHGVHGPSRVVDPHAFRWSDDGWRGVGLADLVIYELHVGTFTEAGTFDAVAADVPRLRDLGVTAIEIMPVAEFPGARNWGYDGVHLYAPHSAYGGPDGLKRLVDAAHAAGLGVVLDVVYNHLGPEGNYVAVFGPYFTARYRTPWGEAINFDDAESDEVRDWVTENAAYWIREFHVDALRLDAVHAIYDASPVHILAAIAEAAHDAAEAAGRHALVIAESDQNDARLVRPPERGGLGLDGVWSDDFHHAVHVALTGERDGYYVDFAGVDPIAKALRDRFVYDGRRSPFRRRRQGAPATDVPRERFVVCVQNHDQIGNRALGERLTTLVPPPAQRLAAALLLLSPYVPLLFMGEEYGETNPFLYFVSHGDPALVEAVRRGRREEFASFAWSGEVPDPQDEETFRRSRLDRTRLDDPAHAARLRLHRELLALRRTLPALRIGSEVYVSADPGAGWLEVVRRHGSSAALALFNLATTEVAAEIAHEHRTGWTLRLSTDAREWGGAGAPLPATITASGSSVPLPPLTAALYVGAPG